MTTFVFLVSLWIQTSTQFPSINWVKFSSTWLVPADSLCWSLGWSFFPLLALLLQYKEALLFVSCKLSVSLPSDLCLFPKLWLLSGLSGCAVFEDGTRCIILKIPAQCSFFFIYLKKDVQISERQKGWRKLIKVSNYFYFLMKSSKFTNAKEFRNNFIFYNGWLLKCI